MILVYIRMKLRLCDKDNANFIIIQKITKFMFFTVYACDIPQAENQFR